MDRRDYNNEEREVFNNDRGFTPRNGRRFNFSRSDYQNADTSGFANQQSPYSQQPVYPTQPQYNPAQPQYNQVNQPNQGYQQGYVPSQPAQPVQQPVQSQPMGGYQLPQGFQPQQYNNPPYYNPYYPQDGGFDYDGRMPQNVEVQGKKKGLFGFKNKKQQAQFVQGDMQNILIVAPKTLSEVQDIIDNLRNRQAIIVEFNKINEKYAQRILDFLNGAIYALGGCEQRIAENMFLFTPGGVSIQGPSSLKSKY